MHDVIHEDLKTLERNMIEWRRHLHQYPELSFQEYETADYITEILKEIPDISITHPTATSIVASIDRGNPGKTLAFRADIDALPIHEDNTLSYRSKHDGVMHACGHDGHVAILLGLAQILSRCPIDFGGKVKLIFQHAEELPPGGAVELARLGIMDDVDELYGLHLSSAFKTGCFGIRAGVLTAATDEFRIRIMGRGGHSSFPELCIDPIVVGGELILAIQTILSRKLAASERAVISICQVEAGTAYNIIPDSMRIIGSVRTFSEDVREKIREELQKLSKSIAQAHGADAEFKYLLGYDSVINDPELSKAAEQVVRDLFGEEAIIHIDLIYPGEDFSALQKNCKAMFIEAGTADSEKGTHFPHHNASYVMDERMLLPCAKYFAEIVRRRSASTTQLPIITSDV